MTTTISRSNSFRDSIEFCDAECDFNEILDQHNLKVEDVLTNDSIIDVLMDCYSATCSIVKSYSMILKVA